MNGENTQSKPGRFSGVYSIERPPSQDANSLEKQRVDLLMKVAMDLKEIRGWTVRNVTVLFEKYEETLEKMIDEQTEKLKEEQKNGIQRS